MGLQEEAAARLSAFLTSLPRGTESSIFVLCDSDCDGLPSAAILVRALRAAGYSRVTAQPRRKAESAWAHEVLERIRSYSPDVLFVLDLGSRSDPLLQGVPTMLIDHHLPGGVPPGAELITGYGTEPTPTTGLLVYWCVKHLIPDSEHEDLLWLAALSLLSDLGDKAPFPELAIARKRWSQSSLRDATSLLNAPRRTATGDASAALEVLLRADSPKQILSGELPQTAGLLRAKTEVADALGSAKKAAPKFSKKFREELGADLVALRMETPFQVHPLVVQLWRGRFKNSIVMGVNFGFRPGYVHFSARGPRGVNVIRFLRKHAPEGADQSYGNGHDQASGGAVRAEFWNGFITELGFGPEMLIQEPAKGAHPNSL